MVTGLHPRCSVSFVVVELGKGNDDRADESGGYGDAAGLENIDMEPLELLGEVREV